jgi:hypothetical protein
MYTFYTQERWNNWINQVKESKFKLDPEAQGLGREGIVFLDMEEDVILAICKITGKLQRDMINKDEAAANIQMMKEIVLTMVETGDEDKDIMLESVQSALVGVFAAADFFIAGDYDAKGDPEKILLEAAKAEEKEDMDKAFELVGKAGAVVMSGKKFDGEKILEKIPVGFVAEGIDGVDSIAAVLAGGIDYSDEADDED